MRVSDLDRLERATRVAGETEDAWALRMLVASAGAIIEDRRTGERIEIPTLALRSTPKGKCVHFKGGLCSIYPARPSGCSEFDSCRQTDAEAKELGISMHAARREQFQVGGRYSRIWKMLHDAGRRRSRASLAKRVRKLNRKYNRG